MNPQIAQGLRVLLAIVGAFLVSQNLMTNEQSAGLAEALLSLVGSAMAIISTVSAIRAGRRQGLEVNTALALPAYSTAFDLKSALRGGDVKSLLIKQAISTVMVLLSDSNMVQKFLGQLIRLRELLDDVLPPAR